MAGRTFQETAGSPIWGLARRQHGVISRAQLLDAGLTRHAIEHRIRRGRLHPVRRGVFAVGRPEVSRHGEWMAAVLVGGDGAALSHASAADLWGIRPSPSRSWPEVSVPSSRAPRHRHGIRIHRRSDLERYVTNRDRIPVTSVPLTLMDLAPRLSDPRLDRAVNRADALDLIDPEELRIALDGLGPRPGVGRLKKLLDSHTFRLTDSDLERRFLPLAMAAGLPVPLTQQMVSGFRVDFYWPELGLVVETDGLRYHRTPAQQQRDHDRDQAHSAAGLIPLRFSHRQIARDPEQVVETLRKVVISRTRR
jgi:very-short-patch-repair endonuclease